MDRRLRPGMRFNRDRRAAAGDELSRILLRAPDAISVDELFDRLVAAEVADVAGWLAPALCPGGLRGASPRPRLHRGPPPGPRPGPPLPAASGRGARPRPGAPAYRFGRVAARPPYSS